MKCAICSERITQTNGEWVHVHSGEAFCYTGDGSVAIPDRED